MQASQQGSICLKKTYSTIFILRQINRASFAVRGPSSFVEIGPLVLNKMIFKSVMLCSFLKYGMSLHSSMNHLYPRMLYAKFVCNLPNGCEDFWKLLLYFCYFAIISPWTKEWFWVMFGWIGLVVLEQKTKMRTVYKQQQRKRPYSQMYNRTYNICIYTHPVKALPFLKDLINLR